MTGKTSTHADHRKVECHGNSDSPAASSTLKPHFVRIEPDTITGRRFKLTRRARSAVLADLLPDPLHHAAGE